MRSCEECVPSNAGPSAEAPALSAEEAPALPASRPKSLIARKKAAARKDLQAEKHRQAILQALDLHASAPAPAPAFAQVRQLAAYMLHVERNASVFPAVALLIKPSCSGTAFDLAIGGTMHQLQ